VNIFRQYWIALCFVLFGVVGLTIYLHTSSDVVIREEVITSSSDKPIRVRLILPVFPTYPSEQPRPAVIAVPPYNIPADIMEIFCTEFARRGGACAIPDFFGRNPAESRQNMGNDSLDIMTQDVLSIADFLKTRSWTDPKRIGICGHSIGGTVAFLAGLEDPSIRAVVPIGMETEIYPQRPQNLLLLSGLYDEIRPPTALLNRLKEHQISSEPHFNTLYGDFMTGTARQVSISPTSDHFIEPVDPGVIRYMLNWFAAAFAWSGFENGSLRVWWHEVGGFLFLIAVSGLYALGMSRVFSTLLLLRWSKRIPRWLILRAQFIPFSILVIVLWWLGNRSQSIRPFASDFMTSLMLTHVCISVWVRHRLGSDKNPTSYVFRSLISLGLAVIVSFFLAWLLISLPSVWRLPSMILWFPVFVLNMIVLFPLQIWIRIIFALFSDSCTPNIWYIISFLGICLVLNWPVHMLNRLAKYCLTMCQKTPRLWDFSFTPLKGILFLFVWAVCGVLMYRRMAEGMLTIETLQAGLGLLLRLILLPGIIFWMIVRTPFFQRISEISPQRRKGAKKRN
jgi:dienelactone hydrolase